MPQLDIKEILGILQFLWLVGLSLAMWLRKPGQEAAQAVKKMGEDISEQLQAQDRRLTEVETHMEHMPTKEALSELRGTVSRIDERSSGLVASTNTMRVTLQRIEDYLLKRQSGA